MRSRSIDDPRREARRESEPIGAIRAGPGSPRAVSSVDLEEAPSWSSRSPVDAGEDPGPGPPPAPLGTAYESTPRWVVAAILLGIGSLILKILASSSIADLDMFHEMALFREIIALGSVPRAELFAYTPTVYPVVHHEWATGGVLYLVAIATGWGGAGIIGLRLLLVGGIAAACFATARRRGAAGFILAPLVPVAIALGGGGVSPVRAQLFTFLFLAWLLILFERDWRGERRWLAIWFPLFVIWLNLHAGFVVGAGLFTLHTAERWLRSYAQERSARRAFGETWHLLAGAAAMVLLSTVNPYGWEYLPFLRDAILMDRPFVGEWTPIWGSNVPREIFAVYGVSLLVAAYSLARNEKPSSLIGLPLLFAAAFVAARSHRHLPIYGIIWIAYVPGYLMATPLRALLEEIWRRHRVPIGAAALGGGLILSVQAMLMRPWELQLPNAGATNTLYYPVGAVEYLAEHEFSGNLMTPYNSGAYVSWKLFPAVRVGLDSRYEVAYPTDSAEEIHAMYVGDPGWRETLDRHPTDAVLVMQDNRLRSLLADSTSLDGEPRWLRVYQDDGFAIFARPEVAARLPVADRVGESITGSFP